MNRKFILGTLLSLALPFTAMAAVPATSSNGTQAKVQMSAKSAKRAPKAARVQSKKATRASKRVQPRTAQKAVRAKSVKAIPRVKGQKNLKR